MCLLCYTKDIRFPDLCLRIWSALLIVLNFVVKNEKRFCTFNCVFFSGRFWIIKPELLRWDNHHFSNRSNFADELEISWLVSCMHWVETGTKLNCFVDSLSVFIQLLGTLDYSESKISRPREVKDTPWVDCVPIIIDSMMGRLTGLSECHSTIKLAPDPPLLSFCGMI